MPSFDVDDTIVAIASAQGCGLRGVIRISGDDCLDCIRRAFQFPDGVELLKQQPLKGVIKVPAQLPLVSSGWGELAPTGLAPTGLTPTGSTPAGLTIPGELIIWPTRSSYTRQPAAEFHMFASPSLLSMGIKSICRAGARLAQAGEFTLRAFLSGRLDLPQAEAVLAVIDSRSPHQLEGALKQMAGGLSGPLSTARQQLLYILAELEAGLDFVEEDIEFITEEQMLANLQQARQTLENICSKMKSREWSSSLIQGALVGLPNAGKSSLFNALLGNERAIVSDISGTTTDFLTGTVDLDGITIELIDTAGMEKNSLLDGDNRIASMAQHQREKIEASVPLRILCLDLSATRNEWELEQLRRLATDPADHSIVVLTQADRLSGSTAPFCQPNSVENDFYHTLQQQNRLLKTSIYDPASLLRLRELLKEKALQLLEIEMEVVGSTMIRTAESLRAALAYVIAAEQAIKSSHGEEVVAAEIRGALEELGLVVGTVYTDDILDVIFSRFCIGK